MLLMNLHQHNRLKMMLLLNTTILCKKLRMHLLLLTTFRLRLTTRKVAEQRMNLGSCLLRLRMMLQKQQKILQKRNKIYRLLLTERAMPLQNKLHGFNLLKNRLKRLRHSLMSWLIYLRLVLVVLLYHKLLVLALTLVQKWLKSCLLVALIQLRKQMILLAPFKMPLLQ